MLLDVIIGLFLLAIVSLPTHTIVTEWIKTESGTELLAIQREFIEGHGEITPVTDIISQDIKKNTITIDAPYGPVSITTYSKEVPEFDKIKADD